MRYRATPTEVTAIEWTGENLKEVQAFMAPSSPLDHAANQLGINVYDPSQQYGLKTKLAFICPGTMIVKHQQGISGYQKVEFETLYEPIEDVPMTVGE